MLFYGAILIPFSCYIGCSDIKDESKTAYFVVFSIVTIILLLFKFL